MYNVEAFKVNRQKAQVEVTDSIALAKAVWLAHQADIVHNMCFSPREAWKSVRILAGGLTSHHIQPTVM